MIRLNRVAVFLLLGCLLLPAPARAGEPVLPVDAVPLFTGEARAPDGRSIPGSYTFIVRVFSAVGNIRAFDFTGFDSVFTNAPRGIAGNACQRWISSQANGVYDVPSPGFQNDLNNVGDFSFDTHFLGDPAHLTITTPLTETGVNFSGGNPLHGLPWVGYGVGREFGEIDYGLMQGGWTIAPEAQSSVIDIAYVAAAGSVGIAGSALTQDGWHDFRFSTLGFLIPEPGAGVVVGTAFLSWGCRPKRNNGR